MLRCRKRMKTLTRTISRVTINFPEEVDGDDLLRVVPQKVLPRLGRWPSPIHVLGNGGGAKKYAEFQQLARDSRSSPGGIVVGHLPDEFTFGDVQ